MYLLLQLPAAIVTTVELGVSDFGYRIFVSVVSCMDTVRGLGI